jgi:hypothetical protein
VARNDIGFTARFPVGRAAPAWQIAGQEQYQSAREKAFRTGHF